MEADKRKHYWRHTKWQMIASLLPFLLLVLVLPLYVDRFNSNKFLGFPLGYFMMGHGLLLISIFTVASFINRQDAIDHWHGANEEI